MADLQDLLLKTSRTFALSIPLLPEPTQREVGVAYLLFRIADTFEDAATWPRQQRIEALNGFAELLREPSLEQARRLVASWVAEAPSRHDGYLELLSETPAVLQELLDLSPAAVAVIKEHTIRTAQGMGEFVARTDDSGVLRLRDVPDLQAYCYVVAGIVGEMLTELFLLDRENLQGIASFLRPRAARFGEALQLVNILKDSADDTKEGRCYLPDSVNRAEIFRLAREDLRTACAYTLALQEAQAPRGLVAFNALPVNLAWASLDRVEEEGPGSKLTRDEVFQIVNTLEQALDRNEPAVAC